MTPTRASEKGGHHRRFSTVARNVVIASTTLVVLFLTVFTSIKLSSVISAVTHNQLVAALSSSNLFNLKNNSTVCNGGRRAVVYNRAPKTASSFIEAIMVNWTRKTGRPLYQCHLTPMLALVQLRSCLPEAPDPCGVFPCHVYLNEYALTLFKERLPNHLLMTSTRFPAHRIVSMFLFTRNLRDDDPSIETKLTWYVENLNPWRLYNYHTGEYMTGSCPLTEPEIRRVWSVVTKFDVVIDLNSFRASNAILKRHQLFTLPNVTDLRLRHKEHGAVRVNITDNIRTLLADKICVELELHRALQLKMARLYEDATGERCIFDENIPTLDTCILREEAEALKDYWKL